MSIRPRNALGRNHCVEESGIAEREQAERQVARRNQQEALGGHRQENCGHISQRRRVDRGEENAATCRHASADGDQDELCAMGKASQQCRQQNRPGKRDKRCGNGCPNEGVRAECPIDLGTLGWAVNVLPSRNRGRCEEPHCEEQVWNCVPQGERDDAGVEECAKGCCRHGARHRRDLVASNAAWRRQAPSR